MENYKFFNDTEDDIREYNANDFAEYFMQNQTNGVYRGGLKPFVVGTDMNVNIKKGNALINGRLYTLTDILTLTLDSAHAILDRIDRIAVRLDLEKGFIKCFVKKGVETENPVAPELTRNEKIYELSLCQVLVKAGKTFISIDNLKDERMKADVCGIVSTNLNAYRETNKFNMFITKYDANNNAVEVEYRDLNNNLFKKTYLENVDSMGNYQTLYELDYLENDVVGLTTKWTISYNSAGLITSKKCEVI
ncbi:hypothetical protein FDA77_00835 [Clostridium botulinum]|nr:hypothetical protein [Clostridium botulinum]NFJ88494.1 hypothetical protein [Clostridium botulinum]HDI3121690.1 hypothetical protein [Clostridium botulinum]